MGVLIPIYLLLWMWLELLVLPTTHQEISHLHPHECSTDPGSHRRSRFVVLNWLNSLAPISGLPIVQEHALACFFSLLPHPWLHLMVVPCFFSLIPHPWLWEKKNAWLPYSLRPPWWPSLLIAPLGYWSWSLRSHSGIHLSEDPLNRWKQIASHTLEMSSLNSHHDLMVLLPSK